MFNDDNEIIKEDEILSNDENIEESTVETPADAQEVTPIEDSSMPVDDAPMFTEEEQRQDLSSEKDVEITEESLFSDEDYERGEGTLAEDAPISVDDKDAIVSDAPMFQSLSEEEAVIVPAEDAQKVYAKTFKTNKHTYGLIKTLDETNDIMCYGVEDESGEKYMIKYYKNGDVAQKGDNVANFLFNADPSKHVTPLLEFGNDGDTQFEVFPHYKAGNLKGFGVVGEDMLHEMLPQINEALHEIHLAGLVHGDVNRKNIFFDANYDVFIGNFNLESDDKTPKDDYFDLGITIASLLRGEYIFNDYTEEEKMQSINTQSFVNFVTDSNLSKLVIGLTQLDPRKRFGYNEVKAYCDGEEVSEIMITDIPDMNGSEEDFQDVSEKSAGFVEQGFVPETPLPIRAEEAEEQAPEEKKKKKKEKKAKQKEIKEEVAEEETAEKSLAEQQEASNKKEIIPTLEKPKYNANGKFAEWILSHYEEYSYKKDGIQIKNELDDLTKLSTEQADKISYNDNKQDVITKFYENFNNDIFYDNKKKTIIAPSLAYYPIIEYDNELVCYKYIEEVDENPTQYIDALFIDSAFNAKLYINEKNKQIFEIIKNYKSEYTSKSNECEFEKGKKMKEILTFYNAISVILLILIACVKFITPLYDLIEGQFANIANVTTMLMLILPIAAVVLYIGILIPFKIRSARLQKYNDFLDNLFFYRLDFSKLINKLIDYKEPKDKESLINKKYKAKVRIDVNKIENDIALYNIKAEKLIRKGIPSTRLIKWLERLIVVLTSAIHAIVYTTIASVFIGDGINATFMYIGAFAIPVVLGLLLFRRKNHANLTKLGIWLTHTATVVGTIVLALFI